MQRYQFLFAAPHVLLIYRRPLTLSKCKNGSQPSTRSSDDKFSVPSLWKCVSQEQSVQGAHCHRAKVGRSCTYSCKLPFIYFPASQLTDKHKLDLFCPPSKTLLMVFHLRLQTSCPYPLLHVLDPARPGLQESGMCLSLRLLSGFTLVAWNQLCCEYLHHGNWQTPQRRALGLLFL